MGRGEAGAQPTGTGRMPGSVRRLLPADAAKAWVDLAPHLPRPLYLGGGTAVMVYLQHRESRDLDSPPRRRWISIGSRRR